MKIKLDIDCTPQELRTFLGLPDLTPIHAIVVDSLKQQIAKTADPEALMKEWAGLGAEGMALFQRLWADQSAASGKKSK
jgi:uncharacterized protein DUF6489